MKIKIVAPSEKDAIIVAAQGFMKEPTPEFERDVTRHLQGDLTLSIEDVGKLKGFAVFNMWEDLVYLSGIILKPGFQGKGIAKAAINHARHILGNPTYLGLRTQSPHMWSVGNNLCQGGWLPSLQCSDPELAREGYMLADRLGGMFPVTLRCYGKALYGQKPVHKDPNIQKWWDEICNFDRGDAVICIGRFL